MALPFETLEGRADTPGRLTGVVSLVLTLYYSVFFLFVYIPLSQQKIIFPGQTFAHCYHT